MIEYIITFTIDEHLASQIRERSCGGSSKMKGNSCYFSEYRLCHLNFEICLIKAGNTCNMIYFCYFVPVFRKSSVISSIHVFNEFPI